MPATLSSQWHLIAHLARRDMSQRYKGSLFGFLWAILQPLLTLGVYAVAFTIFFPQYYPGGGRFGFLFILFAGLLPYQLFTEVVSRSPALIRDRASLVKKTLFPTEILPLSLTGSCLLHNGIGWGILLTFLGISTGSLPLKAFLLPMQLLPLVLLALGLSWLFSALGVFLGDLRNLIGILLHMLFFLTPVLYPLSKVSPGLRTYLLWNPLTTVIENCRSILVADAPIAWAAWLGLMGLGVLATWGGWACFLRMKKFFADVL